MIKFISQNGAILGAFALVSTSLIAITNYFTITPIAEAKEKQLLLTLNQVIPNELYNNELHLDCSIVKASDLLGNRAQRVYRARYSDENRAVVIETTTPNGYSGNIDMIVAINTDKEVLGARVVSHKETPGLGDKIDIRVSDWILSVNNKVFNDELRTRWNVKKDGGEFDQFTGATITPRAVIRAVANAAEYANNNIDTLFSLESNCIANNTDISEHKTSLSNDS